MKEGLPPSEDLPIRYPPTRLTLRERGRKQNRQMHGGLCLWINIAGNTLKVVSIITVAQLIPVSGVEVVVHLPIPVAVEWNRTRLLRVVDVALHPLKLKAIS